MDEFQLYKTGLSIPEVSHETGIALSTLRFRFKKAGILRDRTTALQNAALRGRLGSGWRGKHRIFTPEHKEKIRLAAVVYGERTARGISLKPSGYIEITRGPNKGRSQHRVVMEGYLGRELAHEELVHHKNEIKSDNRTDNLEMKTVHEHPRHHRLKDPHPRDEKGRFYA